MSFDFVENFTVELPDFSNLEADFAESFNSKQGLIIEVAAIHEGLTANYNNYSAQELEKALESWVEPYPCLLYTSPSPRDRQKSRMPSSA